MIISLCSGYGGLDRAVAAAFRLPIAAHAEPEKLTAKMGKAGTKLIPNPVVAVLEARFPGVPNLGDITAVDWALWRERCTVLCAGFPCQPVSAAGRQLAEDDERWLWPSVHRMFLVARRRGTYGAEPRRWAGKACAVAKGFVLPTPTARDWRLTGPSELQRNSAMLSALPLLLPTPVAKDAGSTAPTEWERNSLALRAQVLDFLRTPAARDGDQRGQGSVEHMQRRMESGHTINLGDQLALLPTPTALSYGSNQGGGAGRVGAGRQASDALARQEHFGRFAWAVDRWADAFGGGPPAPTETGMPGQRGGTRMAAPFPEWMMGLRAGYVTDVLPRNDALRAIGNGVMPQQGYAAIGTLLRLHG